MKILIQFEKKPVLFQKPESIISCSSPSLVSGCFRDIESALKDGYYAAGFLSYEAGYCFEERLLEDKIYDFPLIHMGVYKAPLRSNISIKSQSGQNRLKNVRINISQDSYSSNIHAIRGYIAKGDVYQVTYCIKLLFDFHGDPFSFYAELLAEQPVPYPAYIETDQFNILSLSPEMFLKKESASIVTKPMKGTWPRGNNMISDLIAPFQLKYDKKNRAENVMIADLLRNDLGRVGMNIRAPKLFEVAKYATLCQMTSTVTGSVDKRIPVYELFKAVFPSGSVTGAPKMAAMEIIRELEGEERKIYTGAIGYITPQRDMFFNIPIRTLLIKNSSGEMGIGGGIVWDSTPQGEWAEGLLKGKFLTDKKY